jgi:flagellar biosynthesis chaperone FliJ
MAELSQDQFTQLQAFGNWQLQIKYLETIQEKEKTLQEKEKTLQEKEKTLQEKEKEKTLQEKEKTRQKELESIGIYLA